MSKTILLAPDKFKGSIDAMEICVVVKTTLLKEDKNLHVITHPMADGGDGSLAVLSAFLDFTKQTVHTCDPLGRNLVAHYYGQSNSAYIELSAASGLVLLDTSDRNPMISSSYGTGLMIKDAIIKGFQNIYLFLGGSATNDAGIGICAALGFEFKDKNNSILNPSGGQLINITHIDNSKTIALEKVNITLLYDVTNPLYGKNGATNIYAAQKGASLQDIEILERGVVAFSKLMSRIVGKDIAQLAGMGATGGIPFSLVNLCNAKMGNGFNVIAELTGLETAIKNADLVISGEGQLDLQSTQGKVIGGIATLCKKYQKPLIAIVGKNDLKKDPVYSSGISQVIALTDIAPNQKEAIKNPKKYLALAAKSIIF